MSLKYPHDKTPLKSPWSFQKHPVNKTNKPFILWKCFLLFNYYSFCYPVTIHSSRYIMPLINGKSGFFFQRSPYNCALGFTVRQILVTINKSIRHLYTCTFTRRLTVSSMNRIRHCLLGKTLKKTPTFYTSYYISNELVLYWVVQIYIDKNSTYLQCSTTAI